MASSPEFIEFVCAQIANAGIVRNRKMFGDYMIYVDDRPVFLVCDNTVYVKQIPPVINIFHTHNIIPDTAIPYNGAREHIILDIENTDLATEIARELVRVVPMRVPRNKKHPKQI